MIWFVTNRNPNHATRPTGFGKEFNRLAVDNLRFGRVTRGKSGRLAVEVEPETLSADAGKQVYGSRKVFAELQAAMTAGADTLVFIHGYNVDFKGAVAAALALKETYGAVCPLNVVLFTWPSDGSMMPLLAYRDDRTDARLSAAAFARGLAKLHDVLKEIARGKACGGRIHLMCHSMGNYVLRGGIQAVIRSRGALPRMFDEIFLMAADEDHDAFELEHKLQPLPELGRAVHVYFNRGDTALVISDKTKSNPTRLGSSGPRAPLLLPGNVELVEASEVVGGLVEHDYYLTSAEVARDVRAVLSGQAPDLITGRRYVPAANKYVLRRGA